MSYSQLGDQRHVRGRTLTTHCRSANPRFRVSRRRTGVSLEVFVDWLIADGAPITRMSDHSEWVSRFEGALRALPEKQRQRSALALLDAMRAPAQPLRGAVAPTDVFRKAVKLNKIGAIQDIPQIDSALIRKTVADIERLGLI